jgi:hypothetical protein
MTLGHSLERALSRPTAKPYRTRNVQNEQFHLNQQGHLTFSPGDIENPKEWSTGRRWYITLVAVLITVSIRTALCFTVPYSITDRYLQGQCHFRIFRPFRLSAKHRR